MVDVDKAVVSRLKKSGKHFEILVDPMKALEFKKGGRVNIDEILAYPGIYHDVRRGDVIPASELQANFGTTDIYQITKKILMEGELQFTTEQRRKFVEEKTKEIADIISRRGINPQTNTPHPPQRIINAMEKAGVHVDPFIDAEMQVNKIIESIKPLIPIKFQKVVVEITIPPHFTGKTYSVLKKSVGKFEEKWLNDGSLQIVLNIPAGSQDEIFKKIGDVTKGNFKSNIIKRVDL
ncbi:MAG: ribosome assembly factor SBDS [Candidatus Aenigmarchaeota archaeon]|nr:ribosome assembly factor SBDS [Candidatus Aenigmarchaeota archaeon]